MISSVLVDALDLQEWANRRDAQATLPELLRRLALASSPSIKLCDFPAGEGIQQPGWDGIIEAGAATTYVPEGVSGWEVSTSKDIANKANTDYQSRSDNPLELNPESTNYICVTLRAWRDKRDWIRNRRQEQIWHDVRAYDAHDIETWLQETPSVHLYVSSLLGKQPMSVADGETYWSSWVSETIPSTPSELVLAGRDEVVRIIQTWIQSGEPEIAVRAETRQEAIAVFLASVSRLPADIRDTIFARTIIIDDPSLWRSFNISQPGLVLVANFERGAIPIISGESRNRVIVPLSHSDRDHPNSITVPRLSSEVASEVLMKAGFDQERARVLALGARLSLMAFRRSISRSRLSSDPQWSKPEIAREIVPLLMAGAWDDVEEGDREQLEALANTSYDNVSNIAVRWANEPDPPLRRIGTVWTISSKEDAWQHLLRYLVEDDLQRLETSVLNVLGTPNPKYELQAEDRWQAAFLGKRAPHSDELTRGLAETLAVIGAWHEQILNLTGIDAGRRVDAVVGRLLGQANDEEYLWASLSPLLPLLGEASPDVFLAAVENGIDTEPSIIAKLFSEEGDPIFTSSPHTGLLWALEVISWSSEWLGLTAGILAKLTRLDPGGRLANRPFRSLRAVFLPWLPQTSVSLDARLRVIDRLRASETEVSWKLMLDLLPQQHDHSSHTATPKWRPWRIEPIPDQIPPEYPVAIGEISKRLLEDAKADPTRLVALVQRFTSFSGDQREEILAIIREVPVDSMEVESRVELWSALREFISRHRSFPDAQWSLSEEWLEPLANIYSRVEPEDPLQKTEWLFTADPKLIEGTRGDWRMNLQEIERARKDAVTQLHRSAGLDAILVLAGRSERPDAVGFSLGSSDLITNEDDFMQDHLASPEDIIAKLSRGFVLGRISLRGIDWAVESIDRLRPSLSCDQIAVLLTSMPPEEATFDLVEQQDTDTQAAYWQSVQNYSIKDHLVNIAARKMIDHGKPYSAIDLMGFFSNDPDVLDHELVAEALEVALHTKAETDHPMTTFGYHVAELLTMVERGGEVDERRIAALEWAYLPLFGSKDRRPAVLHRELARAPEFFVEVIRLAYRGDSEEPRALSQEDQNRATNAYLLLDSWKTIPSTQNGEVIDLSALKNWVLKARELLSEHGRLGIGDEIIGKMLSAAPVGQDGIWPHESVRIVVEEIGSDEIEKGLELGVFNSRGVTSRGPYEGGNQERDLVENYTHYTEALADEYPRTAAVLRRLAETFTRMAHQKDDEAELREDLGR